MAYTLSQAFFKGFYNQELSFNLVLYNGNKLSKEQQLAVFLQPALLTMI